MTQLLAKCELVRLLGWCSKRGISVVTARGSLGMCDFDRNLIEVPRSKDELCTYDMLLHECGHWLWWKSVRRSTAMWLQRWRKGNADTVPRNRLTNRRKLALIDEEFDAWNRGERLGMRLSPLTFDSKHFERTKAICLRTYFVDYLVGNRTKRAKKHRD